MGESTAMIRISLVSARVNAGLTQEMAAKSLGVTVPTLIGWEKGIREPKISQARKISDLYKIPLDNIFFGR